MHILYNTRASGTFRYTPWHSTLADALWICLVENKVLLPGTSVVWHLKRNGMQVLPPVSKEVLLRKIPSDLKLCECRHVSRRQGNPKLHTMNFGRIIGNFSWILHHGVWVSSSGIYTNGNITSIRKQQGRRGGYRTLGRDTDWKMPGSAAAKQG